MNKFFHKIKTKIEDGYLMFYFTILLIFLAIISLFVNWNSIDNDNYYYMP